MTKKDFIALADMLIRANTERIRTDQTDYFSPQQLDLLADFCQSQNSQFNRARWLGYVNGDNGPSGGAVKRAKG